MELIIVIVLLGIVGVMSTDIISQTYRNYVYQKEVADLQSRSKQLVDQITHYLDQAIKPSVARFDGVATHDSVWELNTVADANGTNFLEWIGKDLESQRGIWNGAMVYPGYSGLANVRDSNGSSIITADSNLSVISQIEGNVTGVSDPLDGNNLTPRAALYFVYANSGGSVQNRFWNNPTSLFAVKQLNVPVNGVITVTPQPPEIGEQYYLTYSAYGIQLGADGTLRLTWNFRPWNGQTVFSGQTSVLMENVTSFEYWSESQGTLFRFKVCLRDDDPLVRVCKEGMVLR